MSWRSLAYGSQQAAQVAAETNAIINKSSTESNNDISISSGQIGEIPKSVGGKVYHVLQYLHKVPMHQAVGVDDIFSKTGIDLNVEEAVQQRLKNNPKIAIIDNKYAYQAKYDVKNKQQLQKILDRCPEGIPKEDLIDCYVGIEKDLTNLVHQGEIMVIKNVETAADVYYPREFSFLVECSNKVIAQPGGFVCQTLGDLTPEIRRGDAVKIGDYWSRVSCLQKSSSSVPEPMAGMTNTKSVSSVKDLATTKKLRYALEFNKEKLPLDVAYPVDDYNNQFVKKINTDELPTMGPRSSVIKHGCTNDIRSLWNDTLRTWPTDHLEFERKLVQAGLVTNEILEANRKQRKPRLRQNKKKPKKQRAERSIKISNQHLLGTELGNLLTKGGESEAFSLGSIKYDKR